MIHKIKRLVCLGVLVAGASMLSGHGASAPPDPWADEGGYACQTCAWYDVSCIYINWLLGC